MFDNAIYFNDKIQLTFSEDQIDYYMHDSNGEHAADRFKQMHVIFNTTGIIGFTAELGDFRADERKDLATIGWTTMGQLKETGWNQDEVWDGSDGDSVLYQGEEGYMISSRNNDRILTADPALYKWMQSGDSLVTDIYWDVQGGKMIGFQGEYNNEPWNEVPQDFGFGGTVPHIFSDLKPVIALAGNSNGARVKITDATCAENGDTFNRV